MRAQASVRGSVSAWQRVGVRVLAEACGCLHACVCVSRSACEGMCVCERACARVGERAR